MPVSWCAVAEGPRGCRGRAASKQGMEGGQEMKERRTEEREDDAADAADDVGGHTGEGILRMRACNGERRGEEDVCELRVIAAC